MLLLFYEHEERNMIEKIRKRLQQYWRVLKITKTPTRQEFWAATKVSGAGLLLVGAIGYLIYLVIHYIYIISGVI